MDSTSTAMHHEIQNTHAEAQEDSSNSGFTNYNPKLDQEKVENLRQEPFGILSRSK